MDGYLSDCRPYHLNHCLRVPPFLEGFEKGSLPGHLSKTFHSLVKMAMKSFRKGV